MIDYQPEDKVIININPAQVKGMPHRRFQGYVGVVKTVNRRSIEPVSYTHLTLPTSDLV